MTDEERQKLCANLRGDAYALTDSFALHNRTAADEIERLGEALEKANEKLRYFEDQQIEAAFNTRPSIPSSRS